MSARCAACEQPIGKGERFVLTGTEVLHRQCASLPSARNTVRTRLELRAIDLENKLVQQRNSAARALIERDEARRQLADERERTRAAIATRQRAESDLQVARAARDAVGRQEAYSRAQHDAMQADVIRLGADLASARADLARVRAEAQAKSPEPAELAKDNRDPSELRFSLLELDKP